MKKQRTENRRRETENKKGIIFVISGPSGSGKTTLIKRLLATKGFKNNLTRIITCTTRPRREGEKNREDYIFLNRQDFKQKIKRKEFLEWQKVLGEYYGTPRDEVEKNISCGRDIVLCIDVKGANALRLNKSFCFKYIFIMPSRRDWRRTLKARLTQRSSEPRDEICKRLRLAEEEIAGAKVYDHVVVNKNIKEAAKELALIIASERARQDGKCSPGATIKSNKQFFV